MEMLVLLVILREALWLLPACEKVLHCLLQRKRIFLVMPLVMLLKGMVWGRSPPQELQTQSFGQDLKGQVGGLCWAA